MKVILGLILGIIFQLWLYLNYELIGYRMEKGKQRAIKEKERSRGKEMDREAEAPLLGQLPVDPDLAALCDSGDVERYNTEPFTSLSAAFIQAMPASSRTA